MRQASADAAPRRRRFLGAAIASARTLAMAPLRGGCTAPRALVAAAERLPKVSA